MKKLLLLIPFLLFAFTSKYLLNYNIDIHCDKLLHKSAFDICYSCKLKNPKAVVYQINGSLLKGYHYLRKGLEFRPDYSLPRKCRSYPQDYSHTGYDRGHNCPNAVFNYSRKLQKETFLMSNIAPQAPQFNRHLWAKIEKFARHEAIKYGKVDIITGTCGNLGNLGRRRHYVNIPKWWYKIIFLPNGKTISFLALNTNTGAKNRIKKYLIPLEEIEKVCKFQLKLLKTKQN
jgi:endonuclease G